LIKIDVVSFSVPEPVIWEDYDGFDEIEDEFLDNDDPLEMERFEMS